MLLALFLGGCGFEGDPASVLASSPDRLDEITARRGPVIGVSLLIWLVELALVFLFGRARLVRPATQLFTLSVVYLPLALLVGAALEPSVGVERLLVVLGCPALALLTLAGFGGYRALAFACAATVLAYSVDVIAGSPLTQLSLIGPNPAGGHRFYGIGNELEAVLVPLVLVGTGAALAGFAPRLDRRRAAAAVLFVAAAFSFVFAYGRFGADVGAAIVLPLGACVAAALLIGRPRLALLALLVPLPALALLAAADLIGGSDAHLTRTVLQAESGGDVAAVLGRRLREAGESFGRSIVLAGLPLVLAGALLAWARRRRLQAWLVEVPAVAAGLAGASAATVVGTVANDSGGLILVIGSACLAAFTAFAWAETNDSNSRTHG